MTVHTLRQITALQRANVRWQQRQARPQPARQLRMPPAQPPRTPVLDRFLRACDHVENSRLFWKCLVASFLIGYAAFIVTHWPKP